MASDLSADAMRAAVSAWRASNPEVKSLAAHVRRELRWALRAATLPPLTPESVRSMHPADLEAVLAERGRKIRRVFERTELRREALGDAQEIVLRFGLAVLPLLFANGE